MSIIVEARKIFVKKGTVKYYTENKVKFDREGGDIGLFNTLVPKVL